MGWRGLLWTFESNKGPIEPGRHSDVRQCPLLGVKQTSLSSRAALLDIFEIGYRRDFLANARQQGTRCADPFVRAVTVGVRLAVAITAERQTLDVMRHHAA
jgi:hypothetical protein